MFEKLKNSWQLVKASWAVLQTDRELLLFPVFSGIAAIIVTLCFFLPMIPLATMSEGEFGGVLEYAWLFLFYLVQYTVIYYFNTALIGAALLRLDGGDPTVRYGLSLANERLSKIIGFALMSATVGLIIRFIQERAGFLGDLIAGLGGLAWNLVTYLVIPILIVHDVGPIEAVKRSARLFKETWGEQVAGEFSIGTVFGLLMVLVAFVGFGLSIWLGSTLNAAALLIIGVVVTVVLLISLGIVSAALSAVYQAALYRYAETGTAPDAYDVEMIRGAFKPKKKKNA